MKVPQHVAIILDGNGRWAKAKGMPRNYGHAQGSKNVERICEEAWRMGIKYLTVYAFSTENWNRPKDEVDALMKLLRNYMKTCLKTAAKNDMKVRVIGDIEPLDEDIKKRISELEAYLLWQLAYSEFYFTDVPWPDFTKDELVKAVEEYNHRHRRFGRVEEG